MPLELAHVQTQREIRERLAQAGLTPHRRFGQNFLIDGNLMRKLVASAELADDDLVIEIGAGTGGLTDLLAASGARVVALEIDQGLYTLLQDRFESATNVHLIVGDALESKHRLHRDLVEFIRLHSAKGSGVVKLVANLPYNVATPIVMNLLVEFPQVQRLCFTVQAEVADRILAIHGSKAYGPLSIISQLLAEVSQEARLPKEAFWPRPEVLSTMLRLDVRPGVWLDRQALIRFVSLVRSVFEHRRKTLRAALRYVVAAPAVEEVCARFDGSVRPEGFSPTEWVEIFETIADKRSIDGPRE